MTARGTGAQKACKSGASSATSGRSGNTAQQRVVFPDCRGPVRVTTGNFPARSRSLTSRTRGIMARP